MIWNKTVILWISGAVLVTNIVTNVVTYVTVEQQLCPPAVSDKFPVGSTPETDDGTRF